MSSLNTDSSKRHCDMLDCIIRIGPNKSGPYPMGSHSIGYSKYTQQQNKRVCVYSNSRKDVPRVAQRYGTIAAQTRCHASVLVVFVVFCAHMYSFAGFSSLGADILVYWIGKIVRTCAPGGSQTLDFLRARRAPYPLGKALR